MIVEWHCAILTEYLCKTRLYKNRKQINVRISIQKLIFSFLLYVYRKSYVNWSYSNFCYWEFHFDSELTFGLLFSEPILRSHYFHGIKVLDTNGLSTSQTEISKEYFPHHFHTIYNFKKTGNMFQREMFWHFNKTSKVRG